mmetsp:Transcript_3724/g.11034  ORF Transcript_3724/g.11034 Transcript_3724/m.11034 type:complete len:85 (+) Transcript_3724:239-493(+)
MLPTVCCLSMRARLRASRRTESALILVIEQPVVAPLYAAAAVQARPCRVLAAPPPSPCALVLSIASVSAERGATASLLLLRRRL